MPKAAALLALALTLITGIVIGQLQQLGVSSVDPLPARASESSSASNRFYAAINHLLRTGDPANLRAVVAPGYVEHHTVDTSSGFDSLEDSLLALRVTFPKAQLETSPMTSDQGLVATHVQMTGLSEVTLAGLPVVPAVLDGSYELLRIEKGAVSERWTSSAMPGHFKTFAAVEPVELSVRLRQPILERLTLAPHAHLEEHAESGAVVIAGDGSLRLEVAESGDPAERLESGDARTIDPGSSFELWNAAGEPASALLMTIGLLDSTSASLLTSEPEAQETGISRVLLAGGANLRASHGPFQLLAGHGIAPPGTAIPLHTVDGAELLFAASGTVDAGIVSGDVWILTDDSTLRTVSGTKHISPNQAISAGSGAELSYTVTGDTPAEFWLITVMPQE